MREAKRLFAKNKSSDMESSPSSIFKSKIPRDLPNDSKRCSVGPGQYNIAFPLVKPKFEAIRKNNNTIIIKVNEKLSPVFQSLEPRFKSVQPQRSTAMEEAAEVYALISTSTREGSQKNQKIEHGMMNRIKKLNEVLRMDEGKLLGEGKDKMTVERLESIQGNEEVVNSLKLYKKERERLHFLLKSIRTRNESKGFEWSKYRETKGNLYSINNVPGPGSYNEHHLAINPRPTRYLDTIEDKSWQFKSLTKRSSFALNDEQRSYQLYPARQKQSSDIDGKFYKVDSIPLIKDRSVSHIDADVQQL